MEETFNFSSLSLKERKSIIAYLFEDMDFMKKVLFENYTSKRFIKFLLENEIFSFKSLSEFTYEDVKDNSSKAIASKVGLELHNKNMEFAFSSKKSDVIRHLLVNYAGIKKGDVITKGAESEQFVVESCVVYMSSNMDRYTIAYRTKDGTSIDATEVGSVNNEVYDFTKRMKKIGL